MEHLPVIQMVKREAEKRRMTTRDLAKPLGLSYSAARTLFDRSTMQVQRLAELSDLFQYNFFRELAQALPYPEPECKTSGGTEVKDEIEKLKARIFELEIENRTLKEAFCGAMVR
ncbi:hypothetical protein [Mangrovibacterium lignilyticum]|uniref:hypothetical protein n=1 Tax=Mangrovibacterium lignilyticum TaxID=2668052 RepID=UPI0013D78356|nr:hypothetical protein [Mangrovibacterium lignilyticum]